MALPTPSLLSCRSVCLLNPIRFAPSTRRFGARPFRWNPCRPNRKFFSVMASENEVFTSPEIAKSFDFASEERIYSWWEAQGYFKPSFDRGADPFVIAMPPPNVTGSLHMGHAMFVTLEDIMVRYNRMKGRPTLWIPGTDHAGIATQLVVEKMLASEGIKRAELGREEFTKRVWEWKEKYGGTITNQIRRLGASCDWTREHFTLDEQLSRAVVEAFVRLHEKGLIYQGSYMVNWSPNLQTAVSDLEVEYSEEPGTLFYIKYRVAGGSRDDFLTIATTRPETLFGDTAIAVNPEDERYAKYIGRQAIVPLTFGRHVPIIADRYVDKEFGTGVLKISPGHDHNDYHIARKLGLPILNVMNKDGTLNEVAGLYCGLDRFEARKKVWSDLEEVGLAVKKESHVLRVPRSQRGGEVIEPLVSKQWFVTMEPLAEKALHAVEKGQLTILPERFEKTYNHWLTNIKDWCISRQLWWGHRIPVWYIVGKDCEEEYIVARSAEEALLKAHEKYGKSVEIYQDPDVLDTWFSSALWPFSTLGWPDVCAEDFKKFYPTTILETGHDILFFWVARMVMMGIEFTGNAPFSYVYLHGLIRDSQGRKMSKTLGNVVDPIDTIKEYGTDALRFTLSLGTAGQDLNLSTERLMSNKALTNKLWNAGKFILQNLPNRSDVSAWEQLLAYKFDTEETLLELPLPECWVVSELHELIDIVTTSYDKFFYGDAGREIYDFFWGDFADWYIEASKTRFYHSWSNSVASVAQGVLLYVFENILILLHPFMPFVTEELWQALPYRRQALIVSQWPRTSLPRDAKSIKRFENLQSMIRAIRNARAEYSVEPAKRISASIVASTDVLDYISSEKQVLALLSRLDLQHVHFVESPPDNAKQSIHLVAGEGLEAYIPLADMVDISAELQRLSKRLSKMQSEYDALVARLNSPSFIEKAPEEVVRGVREKASNAEEKITLTKNRLAFLQSTVSSSV
ncbi:valine--tRNA ligase, chloroplastic/mitochondrial 2-like [Musa acuminata AAA Group]|uniref:valine--tRNA ligase, chloroplastic/mitochondrial 2-like n=1 Tax=Musa acuminata AAA Group TaxID=214697 RepID=UPI0031D89677